MPLKNSVINHVQNNNAKIDDKGNTKLHKMADECKLEEVNKLIAAGANINAKNNDGFTPIFNAVDCFSTSITKKLIDSGADVNAKDNDGCTVLMAAASSVGLSGLSPDNVKLILEAGGDVNVTCLGGRSALSMSMDYINDENINDCLETAKLLVASGATGDIDKLKQLEEEATKKHQAKVAETLKCHITHWKTQNAPDYTSFSLSGVSWQEAPIRLTSDCSVFVGFLGSVQSKAELDGKVSPSAQGSISTMLLSCAKSSNNEKLRQVAKECNGKWF